MNRRLAMTDTPIAEQALDALRRHVLAPLIPRCIDEECGGFFVDFDDRWRPAGPQDKSLEHAARTTIAFAQVDRAMPGQGYERYVRHGCAFLQQAMWDGTHGGFFVRVDRRGRPLWEGLKTSARGDLCRPGVPASGATPPAGRGLDVGGARACLAQRICMGPCAWWVLGLVSAQQ